MRWHDGQLFGRIKWRKHTDIGFFGDFAVKQFDRKIAVHLFGEGKQQTIDIVLCILHRIKFVKAADGFIVNAA